MRYILILTALILIFFGCKEEDEQPAPTPQEALIGYWKGTFLRDGGTKIDGLYILFRTGGTARVYDMNMETDTAGTGISKFDMSYMVSGTAVVVSNNIYTFTGEMNEGLYRIEGTYTNKLSHTGVFSVTKE